MILCVTLNPCLDRTLVVPPWSPGDSIRARSLREVVGGKGNNVARALTRLGRRDVRPVTFLGGSVGVRCAELMRVDDHFDPILTPTAGPTREILTVSTEGTADQTAFFDPDPAISADEASALRDGVASALANGSVEALTLSGSSPSVATHGLFGEMIALARSRHVPVFLDTYGPALASISGIWPDVIQMNTREAAIHLQVPKDQLAEADILGLLNRWTGHGIDVAVVTDGPNPILARVGMTTYRLIPPSIDPVNPIGSGDCFLAGLVDARLGGLGAEAMLRHAAGCAVANALVWDAGGFGVDAAAEQAGRVVVEVIGADNGDRGDIDQVGASR